MDPFTKDDLDYLCEFSSNPCVSMFMPMVKKGKETRQNTIRYKNVLQQAQNQIMQLPECKESAQEILEPAKKLLNEYVFWQNQEHGLALFAAHDFTRVFRLPIELPELIVIADQFHIKPVLPMVTDELNFFILAFSKDEAQLYRCSSHAIEQLQPADMPKGLAEALKFDEERRQFQFYTGTTPSAAPRGDKRAAVFFGQGVVSDVEKNRILQYCRIMDKALQGILHDQDAPLVLAGLEHLLPIYESANTYPHLVPGGIHTNPAGIPIEELHRQAWDLLEPIRSRNLNTAMQKYNDLKGTGMTNARIEEIVPAAATGRVDTLFVALDQHRWGRFDESRNQVVAIEESPSVGDYDLIDLAARKTLINSGRVYPLRTGELPDGALVAALLRY